MEKIINFYLSNQEIIDKIIYLLVSILVMVLISVIKKKPVKVVDSVKDKILLKLPSVIAAAELRFGKGNGEKKLKFVLDFFLWSFEQEGLVLSDNYIEFIKDYTEEILSTPQKKEV